jgi:aldose 1-epimerase
MATCRSRSLSSSLLLAGFAFVAASCQGSQAMPTTSASFGVAEDKPITLYTLTNKNGLVAKITNYGAIVTELHVPDRDGNLEDIVLGFDTLQEYIDHNPYFGCMAGRCANRIAGGMFTLDGVMHRLEQNNGEHHLHGGLKGYDKVVWNARPLDTPEGPALQLTYVSPDGEEHYPGTVNVTVIYTLTNRNELKVETTAVTDEATPVNIVHHSYWNLAGHGSGTILDHELKLEADHYTPGDATLIPTGEIRSVANSPFDFRAATRIGDPIVQLPPSGDDPGGFDLNYVVNGEPGAMRRAATLRDPGSGRVMEIWADQPGVQFYTGNFLNDVPGKRSTVYPKHGGLCLETQKFPDAINKEGAPGWPTAILRPGQVYRHVMVHRFTAE